MATPRDDDDESALDPSEQTMRPLDVALFQQRVKAWSPVLDPWWVIAALLYFGLIMVPVGECGPCRRSGARERQ